MREGTIQDAIRLALGAATGFVLWRNNVGVAKVVGGRVRYGLCIGSSDLIGILAPNGRFVALEVKSPGGKISREQTLFLNLVRRNGGFGAVVRSVSEALQAIERARAGEFE